MGDVVGWEDGVVLPEAGMPDSSFDWLALDGSLSGEAEDDRGQSGGHGALVELHLGGGESRCEERV